MNFDFFTILQSIAIMKYGMLLLLGIFIIFLVVIVRQVASMNSIVNQTAYGTLLQIISILFLVAGISLFILGAVIL